jgi:hypothetical protein
MEKLIYLLAREQGADMDAYRERLLRDVVPALREQGGRRIVVNVADLDDAVRAEAPGRIVGPWEALGGVVHFWLDSVDQRDHLESWLQAVFPAAFGYLVTESVPQPASRDWPEGARRPGLTQFTAHGKSADVSETAFYANWREHSELSFDLHPLRWSYVRNAVARPLQEDGPPYRAMVLEHFREQRDFTEENRYFGASEIVQEMYAELPGFCDVNTMVTGPMSEYHFE